MAEGQAHRLAEALARRAGPGTTVQSHRRPANLAQLFADLETFSLFGDGKVVLIVDSALLADKNAAAELIDEAVASLASGKPAPGALSELSPSHREGPRGCCRRCTSSGSTRAARSRRRCSKACPNGPSRAARRCAKKPARAARQGDRPSCDGRPRRPAAGRPRPRPARLRRRRSRQARRNGRARPARPPLPGLRRSLGGRGAPAGGPAGQKLELRQPAAGHLGQKRLAGAGLARRRAAAGARHRHLGRRARRAGPPHLAPEGRLRRPRHRPGIDRPPGRRIPQAGLAGQRPGQGPDRDRPGGRSGAGPRRGGRLADPRRPRPGQGRRSGAPLPAADRRRRRHHGRPAFLLRPARLVLPPARRGRRHGPPPAGAGRPAGTTTSSRKSGRRASRRTRRTAARIPWPASTPIGSTAPTCWPACSAATSCSSCPGGCSRPK